MNRNKDWLKYSEELIEVADLLTKNGKFFWSCFTLQQASAAALKAIISNISESTFGDNLIALIRLVKNSQEVPKNVIEACHKNNEYFASPRDLESKTEGIPPTNFNLNDVKEARNNTMIIVRYAYHLIQK